MKPLIKLEIAVAILSFGLVFVAATVGHLFVIRGSDPKTVDPIVHAAMLGFFCFFGFSCMGLMLHAFTVLQTGIGNGNAPMVRFIAVHETGITFAVWGFLGLGALVAMPFALRDAGFQMPLRSEGTLSADIGMTVDEVRQHSTIKIAELQRYVDGSQNSVGTLVFEFRIGDSPIRFPQSRFYLLTTPKNDSHISVLHIGITPRKMAKRDIEAFQYAAQAKLFANGWMPGHLVADSEETVHMWGGKRTSQDGRYWLKGNTVLGFERKRMDDEQPGEPPDSGEYVIDIHLETKAANRDLVFEPSAWSPRQQ